MEEITKILETYDKEYPELEDKIELLQSSIWGDHYVDHTIHLLVAVLANRTCEHAYGFDGLETFPDCLDCWTCAAKEVVGKKRFMLEPNE